MDRLKNYLVDLIETSRTKLLMVLDLLIDLIIVTINQIKAIIEILFRIINFLIDLLVKSIGTVFGSFFIMLTIELLELDLNRYLVAFLGFIISVIDSICFNGRSVFYVNLLIGSSSSLVFKKLIPIVIKKIKEDFNI